MKEFTIGRNDAGQRLDRFLAKAVPLLPASLAQKYIRIKRIKCNGKRIDRDTRLQEGDVLQLYINDEFFDKPREDNAYLTVANPNLNIVYEDVLLCRLFCCARASGTLWAVLWWLRPVPRRFRLSTSGQLRERTCRKTP